MRDDGHRLFDGALPALIKWGKPGAAEPLRLHPRNSLPRSGVSPQVIAVTHPSADKLQAAFDAIGLAGIRANTRDMDTLGITKCALPGLVLAAGSEDEILAPR